MSQTTNVLTVVSVRRAMRDYDAEFPANDYRNWPTNRWYTQALLSEDGNRKYPVKLIVALARGMDEEETPGFHTKDFVPELELLGFRVVPK